MHLLVIVLGVYTAVGYIQQARDMMGASGWRENMMADARGGGRSVISAACSLEASASV